MPDAWTFTIAVVVLGATVIVGLAGLYALAPMGERSIPEGLVAITSAAVGALAGLLARPSRER